MAENQFFHACVFEQSLSPIGQGLSLIGVSWYQLASASLEVMEQGMEQGSDRPGL
jgi:hypothetical protein